MSVTPFEPFEPSLYTTLLSDMAAEIGDDEHELAILLVGVEQEEATSS